MTHWPPLSCCVFFAPKTWIFELSRCVSVSAASDEVEVLSASPVGAAHAARARNEAKAAAGMMRFMGVCLSEVEAGGDLARRVDDLFRADVLLLLEEVPVVVRLLEPL